MTSVSDLSTRTRRYVIAERLGRWQVRHDAGDAGAFADLDDALRFACGQARDQARCGVLGIVIVQSDVREMHCFTPPAGARAAPRPRLRVVGKAR